MSVAGQLQILQQGKRGRILVYVRANGRSPAYAFLEKTPRHLRLRFDRAFDEFCKSGMSMARVAVFKPLCQEGKGVWSWKEHDHRLYSFRGPDRDGRSQIVLLSGWVKDKAATIAGSVEERREVEKAQTLKVECEQEIDWSNVVAPQDATKDAAMATVKEPEKALATPERAAEEAPLVSVETPQAAVTTEPAATVEAKIEPEAVLCPAMEPVVEPVVEHPEPAKTFGVLELMQLTGASTDWIRDAISRCELPEGDLRNGTRVWRWEDADTMVARVEQLRGSKKEGPPVGKHICPHCAKEFSRWVSLRGHLKQHSGQKPPKPPPTTLRGMPRGSVSIKALASMLGVHASSIYNLTNRGLINPGTKTASRRFWTKGEAESIVVRHREFCKRFETFSHGFKMGVDGKFRCPGGCGVQFDAPAGALSHLKVCRTMWDGPGPAQPVEPVPPAVPVPVVPEPVSGVQTRAELLALAERVIDNEVDPEEFVTKVAVHIETVKRMERELQRIRGGK